MTVRAALFTLGGAAVFRAARLERTHLTEAS